MTICRGLFLGLTILVCTSLIACSKPTKPLPPNEIVEMLIDFPPYPSPPLTEDNASNESFQAVVNHCKDDLSLLGYKSSIQRLLVNEVEAVNSEGDWQWILNEYGTTTTLTVVPKDTLTFVLDVEHNGRHFITVGWVLPNGRAAEIIVEGGPLQEEYLSWNWVANDLWFSRGSSRRNPVRSFMSSSGQGWLAWDGYSGQMIFTERYVHAAWDSYGHGYYESSWGSGNW